MKTFAANEKRSAPAASRSHHYVHHPMGPVQQGHQAAMRKILQPNEVQVKPDISEYDGKFEQEVDQFASDLPVSAISGIPPPGGSGGAPPLQRSDNEEPEKELQRQPEEEEEEPIQAKLIQRQPDNEEEEPVQTKRIQRQMADMRGIRPSRFGYVGPEVKAQQAKIRRILRSTGAQAKLTVGQPNDKYEQEADRVADQVMAIPDPKLQRQPENEEDEETLQTKPLDDQITPLVQRQEESPEEEEEPVQAKFKDGEMIHRMCSGCEEGTAQRQPMEEEEEELQAKSKAGETPAVTPSLESRINGLKAGGQPLSSSVRDYMEPRIDRDFSQVRVHTDSQAVNSAQSINARAFTLAENIVFDSGKYSPTSNEGKRLLAHELTHVVQQGRAPSYTKNANDDRCGFAKSLSASPVVRRFSQSLVIQRDVLDSIGFSLRQSLTRVTEFPDPIARIFDGVVASNIAIASEITIPDSWRQTLLDYSASNPLDGVVLLSALSRFPRFYSGGWIMDLQPAAGAMTLDHSIFVPKGRNLSLSTYIHEMVHVAQYGALGTTDFLTSYFGLSGATIAIRWARGQPTNPMRSSPHEEQAYNLEARFRRRGSSSP